MATDERSAWKVFRETVLLLVVAVALAVGVKTFLVQAFYIPSDSMNPGLQQNDRILVEKPSYWFGHPQRGDIVVFSDPGGWLDASEDAGPGGFLSTALEKIGLYPSGGHLVKRVIGVPGDSLRSKGNTIYVNNKPLDENWTHTEPLGGAITPITLKANEYFMMGDNHSDS